MSNIALSIDLNTMRLTRPMLERIIYDLSSKYSVTKINIYNFSAQKATDIGGIKHVNYLPTVSGRRKVMIDMRQVADIVELACNSSTHALFVICGMLDSDAVFAKVTELGKELIVGSSTRLTIPYKQYLLTRQYGNTASNDDISSTNQLDIAPTKADINLKKSSIHSSSYCDSDCITPSKAHQNTAAKHLPTSPLCNAAPPLLVNIDNDIDSQLQHINELLQALS